MGNYYTKTHLFIWISIKLVINVTSCFVKVFLRFKSIYIKQKHQIENKNQKKQLYF